MAAGADDPNFSREFALARSLVEDDTKLKPFRDEILLATTRVGSRLESPPKIFLSIQDILDDFKVAVVFGKWLFATLDDTDPDLREPGQQEAWLLLSPGWELVQNQAEVVPEVVAKYFWGTGALVLGNGNAFYTKAEAGRAGQCVGKEPACAFLAC
ncbi:smd2 [Symbiodinium sp. CCMP2592]|nr:smd2 [Symbiodinium sp. CCMP2592]